MTDARINFRQRFERFLAYSTAWTHAFAAIDEHGLKRVMATHQAFEAVSPSPEVRELNDIIERCFYEVTGGRAVNRNDLERANNLLSDLHAATNEQVAEYPDDAREIFRLSSYTGPPFDIPDP